MPYYDDTNDDDYKAALGAVYERTLGIPFTCSPKVREKIDAIKVQVNARKAVDKYGQPKTQYITESAIPVTQP